MSGGGRKIVVPDETRRAQRQASDPAVSAWVSANAGAGKTWVLADRVVRLMLAGTDPGKILCLTYTKAAAAEMANRVFERLSDWAVVADADLKKLLADTEGRDETAPETISGADLARARRLFAAALETPGGLKIQTIHAFCDRLLHDFSLEARVASHFEVLDSETGRDLLAEARARVLHRAAADPAGPLGLAFQRLVETAGDKSVEEAIEAIVSARDVVRRFIGEAGSLDRAIRELARLFAVDIDDDEERILDAILQSENFPPPFLDALIARLSGSGKKDQGIEASLGATRTAPSAEARRSAWIAAFLTQGGEARKNPVTKAILDAFPGLDERIRFEQDRLAALLDKARAIAAFKASAALLGLGDAVIAAYERAKAVRGLIDYEDLIVKTAKLLSRADAADWVQYKLDRGIDHILIDEAQDTSPRQWEVITALAEEFFAGKSARPGRRTLFAVGDEKQSIYSFQGAVPAWFDAMRRRFEAKAGPVEAAWRTIRLTLSFRSVPDVLAAVDRVFAEPSARQGLGEDDQPTVHEAIRHGEAGRVELWPVFQDEKTEPPEDWAEPLDATGADSPARRHARMIADTIADWLARGDRLEGSGKPIRPGDILILVKRRDAFAEAMIRALKDRDVAVAGADRLVLTDHIAIQDLMALGGFCLTPEDDYALACILKSPLIGLTDDDLVVLTESENGPLWRRLALLAESNDRFAPAYDRLHGWRSLADQVPPYEFFARVLGPDGGRRAILARLGREAGEALDAFLEQALNSERVGPASLLGFLSRLSASRPEIKRDLDIARDEVRVMTVHGAKGLEAPVVFLADTCSPPRANHDPKLLTVHRPGQPPDAAPAPVWTMRKDQYTKLHEAALAEARQKRIEEYHRLLYVAMTRAGDRLIVSGHTGVRGVPSGSWYELIAGALQADTTTEERDGLPGPVRVWQRHGRIAAAQAGEVTERPAPAALPGWLGRDPPAAAPAPLQIAPSRLPGPALGRGGGNGNARRGAALHRLLHTLATVAPEARTRTALQLVTATADGDEALAREALALFERADFAFLFGPNSRGEVAVSGETMVAARPIRVEGRIDRLVVEPDRVVIVDYKTGRMVPETAAATPPAHLVQVALYRRVLGAVYPDRRIEAMLVWTATPRLMAIPEMLAESALEQALTML